MIVHHTGSHLAAGIMIKSPGPTYSYPIQQAVIAGRKNHKTLFYKGISPPHPIRPQFRIKILRFIFQ